MSTAVDMVTTNMASFKALSGSLHCGMQLTYCDFMNEPLDSFSHLKGSWRANQQCIPSVSNNSSWTGMSSGATRRNFCNIAFASVLINQPGTCSASLKVLKLKSMLVTSLRDMSSRVLQTPSSRLRSRNGKRLTIFPRSSFGKSRRQPEFPLICTACWIAKAFVCTALMNHRLK